MRVHPWRNDAALEPRWRRNSPSADDQGTERAVATAALLLAELLALREDGAAAEQYDGVLAEIVGSAKVWKMTGSQVRAQLGLRGIDI